MKNSEWTSLKYMDPTKLLVGLNELFDASGIRKYRNPSDILLDRRVREIAEDRRCAIFCHGASQVLGTKILFAPYESADYDYVGAYQHNGSVQMFPIQLKQVVPDRLNSSTCVQHEISKLKKYTDARDLVVAVHINRKVHIKPEDMDLSGLKIKELWLYGELQEDSSTWLLLGNLMAASRNAYTFQLPPDNSFKADASGPT